MAESLQVSPTPLREAIPRLISENLLEQQPIGGVLVPVLDEAVISELYEVRARHRPAPCHVLAFCAGPGGAARPGAGPAAGRQQGGQVVLPSAIGVVAAGLGAGGVFLASALVVGGTLLLLRGVRLDG